MKSYHNRRITPESLEALAAYDKERLRSLVLDYIRSCQHRGSTADEACVALGMMHNSVAPRLTELKSSGAVVELCDHKGKRLLRKTRQGCSAGVLVAAEYAPADPWATPTLFDMAPVAQHRDDN